MAKSLFVISILIAICCAVAENDVKFDPQPPPPETNSTIAPPITTTVAPTTKPPPTPSTTSTTTQAPTTPTTQPPTTPTTQAPTTPTTQTPTTPTTQAPTTPAPIPTTPSPAPTPVPAPSIGTWNVTNTNKTAVCIVLETAAQLNITYTPKANETKNYIINIPVNGTEVTGSCGENENIKISWTNGTLEINFAKNKDEFMVSNVTFKVQINGTSYDGVYNKSEFTTPLKMSYKCDRDEVLILKKLISNETIGELTLGHLQLEAFRTENSTTFSKAQYCWSPTTDIVPIVVGCALAGLVVIVLAAYLVGRRRAAARGYLSI